MSYIDRIKTTLGSLFEIIFPPRHYSVTAKQFSKKSLLDRACPTVRYGHTALLPYADADVRSALFAMKYERNAHITKLFADVLWDFLSGEIEEQQTIQNLSYMLFMVPQTQTRKHKNRYHHLSDLHTHIAEQAGETLQHGTMYWNRNVVRQSSLKTKSERLRNVTDAIAVNDTIPPNTLCFVVDDISTTGATLNACRQALLEAGAVTVVTVTLAH